MKRILVVVLLCAVVAGAQTGKTKKIGKYTDADLAPNQPVRAVGKIPIRVIHSGTDIAGKQVAYFLKEQIRKSAGYELSIDDPAVGYKVELVSLQLPEAFGVKSSAISMIVMFWGKSEIMIGHELFLSTSDMAEGQSQRAIASIEDAISKLNDATRASQPKN